jgi:hypothetical protein
VWLPFLQLHIHLLYLAGAPAAAYLLVPYAYTVLTLFLLAALCRAALRDEREALVAEVLLLVAVAGSSFHWLGRALYQEVIVLPIFLALIYLHYFAPERRGLFLTLLAVGMVTREVVWIWWIVFLVLQWRRQPPERGFRAATIALGVIPLAWLLATRQPPVLARNTVQQGGLLDRLGDHAAILGGVVVSQSFVLVLVCLAAVFGAVLATRGPSGLSCRGYHVFSLLSLGAIYGYVLLFDPWQTTPGNARVLLPLYAHILVWAVLAWRDAALLTGRLRAAARLLATIGILSMLELHSIAGFVSKAVLRTAISPTPGPPAAGVSSRDDWDAALARTLRQLRRGRQAPLRVIFVGVRHEEYRTFWVAPLLYDQRTVVAQDTPLPAADLLVAPEGFGASGWVFRERLRLPEGIVRDLLEPEHGLGGGEQAARQGEY